MKERGTRYWPMKSEPDVYSIENLAADGRAEWEGVRNYQARNSMREMKEGDLVVPCPSRNCCTPPNRSDNRLHLPPAAAEGVI